MNMAFAETPETSGPSGIEPIKWDRQQLLVTLRQASQRATHLKRSVLASFTFPFELHDPLLVWRALRKQADEVCFWEHPTAENALVGAGVALTIEAHGERRFPAAATAWQALLCDAVLGSAGSVLPAIEGPTLFGGFAFDPRRTRTQLWQGFPDALLILPTLLFQRRGEHASIVVSRMVEADVVVESIAEEMLARLQRLLVTLRTMDTRESRAATAMAQWMPTTENVKVLKRDLLPAAEWMKLVAHAVRAIQQGAYEKVVCARSVLVEGEENPDIGTMLQQLQQNYPEAYVFALQRGMRTFIGATPERLLRAEHGRIQTQALAGSAARGMTEEEDQRLRTELLHSQKNKREHEIVIAAIRNSLMPLCSEIQIVGKPDVLPLKNIQHLSTAIVGKLQPGRNVLEVLDALHPTPAVGGFPRSPALAAIRANEHLDRGWYASPIGWIDAHGNGEFAVALRSALVAGKAATLFVGCGIVADSDPEGEYRESCVKQEPILRALASKTCVD